MRLVVADTGPLNYLILIGVADILSTLFERVFIPEAVHAELCHPMAPEAVRAWAVQQPAWLEVRAVPSGDEIDPALQALDDGERAALSLAKSISADLVLIDDRAGVAAAHQLGFAVTGTLGILDLAAWRGLIDLEAVVVRLRATNFRYPPEILDALLAQHRNRRDC